MAAKMYKCQDSAKKLFRNEYANKLQWYVGVLKQVMLNTACDEMRALLFVGALESVKDNGMAIMLFTAATVELIENSQAWQHITAAPKC
jgi:hypothetical protein